MKRRIPLWLLAVGVLAAVATGRTAAAADAAAPGEPPAAEQPAEQAAPEGQEAERPSAPEPAPEPSSEPGSTRTTPTAADAPAHPAHPGALPLDEELFFIDPPPGQAGHESAASSHSPDSPAHASHD